MVKKINIGINVHHMIRSGQHNGFVAKVSSQQFLLCSPKKYTLIGDSELAVGVNVSVAVCLSLVCGPVTNWQRDQDVTPPSAQDSRDSLQAPLVTESVT